MRFFGAAIAALALASVAAEAAASEPVRALGSDGFKIGQAPGAPAEAMGRERPQAVNGSLYAVVAPLYVGEGGFYSYLRLFNGGASTAAFSVTVVGSATSNAYGTATLQVPSRASIQYSMSQILVAANAVNRDPSDVQFSFYIQSTEQLAGYQHVTHSPGATFFQNASVCRWTIQDAVAAVAPSAILTHVHTSRLAAQGYPATIELHNYAATTATYRFTVVEATTGNIVGQTNFTARANASYAIPWSQIETGAGWTPLADQIYANLVVNDTSGAIPALVLGQTVLNGQLQSTLNVTTMCAVNRPSSIGGDGGGIIN